MAAKHNETPAPQIEFRDQFGYVSCCQLVARHAEHNAGNRLCAPEN